jgi:hypothetical protein
MIRSSVAIAGRLYHGSAGLAEAAILQTSGSAENVALLAESSRALPLLQPRLRLSVGF